MLLVLGIGCLGGGLGRTPPRLHGRVRSFGLGCLGRGLGRTPRLHARVRSYGLSCLGGGLGRTLLATSSGFKIAYSLGLGISQSRAVNWLRRVHVSRPLVFLRPVARRHTNTNMERWMGTTQWVRKLHDREAGIGLRVT